MSFPPSLHPISLVRTFQASARRTPAKLALIGEDYALTYAELMAEASKNTRASNPIADWIASMIASETDENGPAATVMEGSEAITLSHRTLALRALNCIVEHAQFGRERATMALALPLDSARGRVAATISLWLGSTLRVTRPGTCIELITSGKCDSAWLGASDWETIVAGLPSAPDNFRLAICDGLPPAAVRTALVNWLGAARVTAETGSIASGKLFRHPGLATQGEPFVGALCA
jgi:hypothetical protein